jgi:hypothetical protein
MFSCAVVHSIACFFFNSLYDVLFLLSLYPPHEFHTKIDCSPSPSRFVSFSFSLFKLSGGNHGCVNVRSAISKEVKGDPSCLGTQQRTDLGAKFRKLFPREKFDQAQGPPRQIAMFGSLFCACPEGDSPSAKRQYDAVGFSSAHVVMSLASRSS